MEKIDFHIHSNLSDGDLSIDEIISLSLKNGCNKIAITDHERIEDYSSYNNKNITIINGIEFNSSENRMHFLGYGIKNINKVSDVINKMNLENEQICYELIEELNKAGYNISYTKVVEVMESLGLNCEIIDKRKIVRYLIYKGYFNKVIDVYDNLIGKGQKYYIPIKKLSPEEIISLINDNGGVSVLAHPFSLNFKYKELLKVIKNLIEFGLDGIEILNGKIGSEYEILYKKIAKDNNLIRTVGTDFHSLTSQTIGVLSDDELYEELNYKMNNKSLKKNL